ncbi:MAG TPA: ABC transporter ATP-binding protein/permease [Stellaceae bacterium]|nr:ABC transporter ATP-binding protein/permease [Stellaceae bacterium]
MMGKGMRSSLGDSWTIAKPYWTSDERWAAWGLLALVVGLNLAQVGLSVVFNYWRNNFYNAIQNYNAHEFWRQLAIFSGLAVLWVLDGVYQAYLQQMLQIRWRRWLTHRYLGRWLDHRAYYKMQLTGSPTDNPDQRIADDLNLFTNSTLNLSLGLLSSVVSLFSFLFILWSLSGPLTIPLGTGMSVTIPAFMVWLALIYAVVGTIITVKVGRPLVGLNFSQQRLEADFRYSLVRLRENTESVAFYGGEQHELGIFRGRFAHVFENFWAIMKRQKLLGWFVFGYGQASVVFPYIVQAPRYFAKQIALGALQQTADAFGQVQGALSFIVNSYTDIATWQSVVQRLASFEHPLAEIATRAGAANDLAIAHQGKGMEVEGLALDLPNGQKLAANVNFAVPPGRGLLLVGPTGVGKSTVLRAIAGIWPFGRGRVRLGEGRCFFVPQKPYIPLGTLRQALAYPDDGAALPREQLEAVLRKVGLAALAPELDATDLWSHRLSVGEQQRLAFARVFLAEPAVVVLDEATSALDEAMEMHLYRLLREAPWHPTIVSVGHRSTLRAFHDEVLDLTPSALAPSAAQAAG